MDLERILSDQKEELASMDLSVLITRDEEAEIRLDSKLAQVVIGVRRCGKSTLCIQRLLRSNTCFAYVNFDDERLAGLKTEQLDDILQALYRINGQFTHLFLDEVQNIAEWPLFVNRMLRQGLHLILTGSNANLLGNELATHMTGRYHKIELFPFTFREYCLANDVDVASRSTKASALRMRMLDKYLFQGGFPELMETDAPSDYTLSLLNAIITKDICKRYNVRNKETLWKLSNLVLDRFCQEVSALDMARLLDAGSSHTIENYLSYLVKAYLLQPVRKFSFKSEERKQRTKYYAADVAFITHHDDVLQTESLGWRLENVVANELQRRLDHVQEHLYYLKKGRSYEVDFAVVRVTLVTQLIQVTYDFRNPSTKLYNREIGGLLKGANDTHCSKLTLIVMEGKAQDIEVDGHTIHIVKASDWLAGQAAVSD